MLAIADGPGRRGTQTRDALYRRGLAASDVVAAAAAVILCVSILGDDALSPTSLAALPLIVVVGKLIGLYDRDELVLSKTTLDEAPKLFQVATLYALLLWLLADPVVRGHLGAAQVLGVWACLFFFTLAARALTRRTVARLAPIERCLHVGDGDAYKQVAEKLATDPAIHAVVVGRVPLPNTTDEHLGDEVVGEVEDLPAIIETLDVHRVILAPSSSDTERMLDVIRAVKSLGVKVSLMPRVFEVVGSSVVFDDVGGMTMLAVRRFGLPRSSQLIKRATDVVGAGIALALASPVIVLIAVATKLDSPGPVFFRQTRVGKDGRQFRMLKFRTMVRDAEELRSELEHRNEADGLFKIAEDPRITRVGGLLRRTSLDELPQLFNVLRGEMSLVGPRPLVMDEDQRVEGWHRRRLHLTPGMTGHCSTSARPGASDHSTEASVHTQKAPRQAAAVHSKGPGRLRDGAKAIRAASATISTVAAKAAVCG